MGGVLSELKTKPKNLAEEHGRYQREFLYRTYNFAHREQLTEYVESSVTLASLRSFVNDQVKPSPRMYVQIKKVLEKEDKPLPEGATTPPDPPSLRKWEGRDAAFNDFASTTWLYQNSSIDGESGYPVNSGS